MVADKSVHDRVKLPRQCFGNMVRKNNVIENRLLLDCEREEKVWKTNNIFVRRCERTDCHDLGKVVHCHTRSSLLAQSFHSNHQRSLTT